MFELVKNKKFLVFYRKVTKSRNSAVASIKHKMDMEKEVATEKAEKLEAAAA